VISFAIFALVSADTNPSSVIAVYNGIRFYPPNETPTEITAMATSTLIT